MATTITPTVITAVPVVEVHLAGATTPASPEEETIPKVEAVPQFIPSKHEKHRITRIPRFVKIEMCNTTRNSLHLHFLRRLVCTFAVLPDQLSALFRIIENIKRRKMRIFLIWYALWIQIHIFALLKIPIK